jgi:rhodanese-related sulfurtransferase
VAATAAPQPAQAEAPSHPVVPKVEPKKSDPPAPKADPSAELLSRFPPLADAPQAEVGSEDTLWLHRHGAVFIDARRTALWAEGHIRGAKVISVWEDGLAEKVEQLSMFSKDLKLPVVVYCSGGDCQDSHLLAQKLWVAGFRNLRIYTGGYPDWEARRGPVTKGDAP